MENNGLNEMIKSIDGELDHILELCEEEMSDQAFAQLNLTVMNINHIHSFFVGSQTVQKIRNKLLSWIQKVKNYLKRIAKICQAVSYSVSFGLPIGISISVTWEVK